MAGNFVQSMAQMAYCYNNVVLPTLRTLLKSYYEIYSVETDTSKISNLLDVYGGCDLILLDKRNYTISGVASRIQIVDEPYDTFTVRLQRDSGSPTEFEKRTFAMSNECIYPKFTFQAYASKEDFRLLSMAVIRTQDLYKFIEKNCPQVKHTGENQIGQAIFIPCKWQDLRAAGFAVSIFHTEETL